jgi:predicted DCC family thiol-disulfide oxidoreductase YuxK
MTADASDDRPVVSDDNPTVSDDGPTVPEDHPVILFDGVCNLCTGAVTVLIRRDPEGVFRFAPLQSEVGKRLAAEYDVPTEDLETVALVENGRCYTKSSAALRAAHHLGGFYYLLLVFWLVPKAVRDWVYDGVASHRYEWFGKREACLMPTDDIRDRFLSGEPSPDPNESRSDTRAEP